MAMCPQSGPGYCQLWRVLPIRLEEPRTNWFVLRLLSLPNLISYGWVSQIAGTAQMVLSAVAIAIEVYILLRNPHIALTLVGYKTITRRVNYDLRVDRVIETMASTYLCLHEGLHSIDPVTELALRELLRITLDSVYFVRDHEVVKSFGEAQSSHRGWYPST